MYSDETLVNKTLEELEQIATALGSNLTAADGKEALLNFIYNGNQPANVPEEKPKKKRGRPSKAEIAAREAEQALAESKAKAEETSVEVAPEDTTKKRRSRKTIAEIEAAAQAKALALANKRKAIEMQTNLFSDEEYQKHAATDDNATSMDAENMVPEQELLHNDSGNDSENEAANNDELIEQLQAKMKAHNDEQMGMSAENDIEEEQLSVWDGDPGDGTDYITIVELPVEDYSATIHYDMLGNPINSPTTDLEQSESQVYKDDAYSFDDIISANGVLEVMPDGFGFLRSSDYNYLSSPDDIYVTAQQVKKYSLKTGDVVECHVRPPHEGEKFFPLTSIDKVNGCDPLRVRDRVAFEHLTPLFPDEKFTLCGDRTTTNLSTRIVDLFSPIGKGQRALIVAQPKTGKTILMKDVANAIAANHPEAYLMMLLIDERPEEVTDMARTVNAEVIASTFDEPADHHVKIAGICLEKAKRLVECGHDVVIFLDSITRLARAYNTVAPASGKILTGGVDANALQKPKRFFGAARNIEGGGSLTIIATALIDTGSKMDEVIFEEFKGTGNMELQLDRQLSNKRIFPAVNLVLSSTRRDDLLQDKTTLDRMWILRKHIADMNSLEAMNDIQNLMLRTRDNDEFLLAMNS